MSIGKSLILKPLTKKCFEALLKKAAQPVSEWEHAQEGKGTLAAHPSGDYSGKLKGFKAGKRWYVTEEEYNKLREGK